MPVTPGYSRAVVETLLGLLGILLFIAGIVSLAGAVTFTVVKLTPARERTDKS